MLFKMVRSISILGCFTYLIAIGVNPALCEQKSHHPMETCPCPVKTSENAAFLITENTPVWLAFKSKPDKPFRYEILEEGIVKKAIDEWRPLILESKYYNIKQTEEFPWPERDEIDYDDLDDVTETDTSRTAMVYRDLHIWITMDYHSSWPTGHRNDEKYIKEKIVYAVAFWNAVHMRLKKTRNPTLRIRIDGIVIVRSHADWDGKWEANYAYNHWQALRSVKTNGTADYICMPFVMTNSNLPGEEVRMHIEDLGNQSIHGDRAIYRKYTGIIFDDERFDAVQEFTVANQRLINVLVNSSIPSNMKPKSYIQLGNPIINPPMPGQVMPLNKQCEALGWSEYNLVSPLNNWCSGLQCQDDKFVAIPTYADDYRGAVDGTPCYKNKVCMEKKCVLKKANTFSYSDKALN